MEIYLVIDLAKLISSILRDLKFDLLDGNDQLALVELG